MNIVQENKSARQQHKLDYNGERQDDDNNKEEH